MAVNMKRIYGTNNAYGYSVELTAGKTSDEVFVPSNVASLTMGIKQIGTGGGFKVQVTMSPREDVEGTSGLTPQWFDWDIPDLDASGFYQGSELQWWVPIPSYVRFVTDSTSGNEVYFSMRAN